MSYGWCCWFVLGVSVVACGGGSGPDEMGGGSGGGSDGGGGTGPGATSTTSGGTPDVGSGGPAQECSEAGDCEHLHDGSVCATLSCIEGSCIVDPIADGTECEETGPWFCREGECRYVECADEDPCEVVEVTNGVCSWTPVDDGPAPSQWQTDGNCVVIVCGDEGTVLEEDPTDIPDDENDCTTDSCGPDGPAHDPVEQGTPCGAAGACDGAGACVE